MAASELTKQLLNFAESPPELSDDERKAFMAACERAKIAVENPLEAMLRTMFGVFESIALRLGIDMKLIDLGVAAKGPITADELASGSGADPILVVRIMRMLVAMHIFKEVGHHTYVAAPQASLYVTGSPMKEGVIHIASQIPPIAILPEYFSVKGYQNPSDISDAPFQFAYHTKENFFDWLEKRPGIQHAFNIVMGIQRMERGEEWFEFYPVAEKFQLQNPSDSDILIVDVGGNVGHDLIAFQTRFPDLPGRLIFTDLPKVVAAAKDLPSRIEGIGHDFFTPLPPKIQGAKIYYLRTVLHDWPDKQARQILENLRAGMRKDSILLINENAMPDEDVQLYQAELDLFMMGIFASLDRTVGQFEQLLNEAGFRLIKVWKAKKYVPGSGMLFEAVIAESAT